MEPGFFPFLDKIYKLGTSREPHPLTKGGYRGIACREPIAEAGMVTRCTVLAVPRFRVQFPLRLMLGNMSFLSPMYTLNVYSRAKAKRHGMDKDTVVARKG